MNEENYNNILKLIKDGFMPEIIKPKSKDNGTKNKYSSNGWIFIKPAYYLLAQYSKETLSYVNVNLRDQDGVISNKYGQLLQIRESIIMYFIRLKNSVKDDNLFKEEDTTVSPGRRTRNIKYKVNDQTNNFNDRYCFKEEVVPDGDDDQEEAGVEE